LASALSVSKLAPIENSLSVDQRSIAAAVVADEHLARLDEQRAVITTDLLAMGAQLAVRGTADQKTPPADHDLLAHVPARCDLQRDRHVHAAIECEKCRQVERDPIK
jgi:hypothetical protein